MGADESCRAGSNPACQHERNERSVNMVLTKVVLSKILLVVLGGLFGWMLGKMPNTWVYAIAAAAIILLIIVLY